MLDMPATKSSEQELYLSSAPAMCVADQHDTLYDFHDELSSLSTSNVAESQHSHPDKALAQIPPLKPTLIQWKNTEHATKCPLLRPQPPRDPREKHRLKKLWDVNMGSQMGTQEDMERTIKTAMRDEAQFYAGAVHEKADLWEQLAQLAGEIEHTQLELSILRHGLKLRLHPRPHLVLKKKTIT